MSEEIITYYELIYSIDKARVKKFLSQYFKEIQIKTSEVLNGDTETIHLEFRKLSGTKAHFMGELRKATQCV